MANVIKDKFAGTTVAITVASMASSVLGVGQQSDAQDNSTLGYGRLQIFVKIKLGPSPTGNRAVYVYFIRGDGTNREDGAGAADAAYTAKNVGTLGILNTGPSPSTGDVLQAIYTVVSPGPQWVVAISHDTVAALDSSGASHLVSYIGLNPEVQ